MSTRLVLAAALVGLLACQAPEPAPAPYRLVDHAAPGGTHTLQRDGTIRRILDPAQPEHTVVLEGVTAPATLTAWLAAADATAGDARFEVWLRPAGAAAEETRLFDATISPGGWQDVQIVLDATPDLEGARLRLRSEGGVWGTPVVRSAGARGAAPSVILVSLDTLRADFVGADGTPDAGTPVLDRLAARGVWYEHAYSPSTWTVPSHISMLSAAYPEAMPPLWQGVMPTLPKALRDAGYLTAAFTGGGFMSPQWGFDAGFDTFHFFEPPADAAACAPDRFDGPDGFTRAAGWIRAHADVPFFLFLHTYDVHDVCPFTIGGRHMDRAGRIAHYRARLADTDSRLGELLAQLAESGIAATTLLVVTSDHGEGFGEHAFFGHGCQRPPFDELTRVPLIVRGPGVRPARVAAPVSVIDVPPTILAFLGLPVPERMQGHALPGLGLPTPSPPPPVFVHCGDWLATRVGRHKLISTESGTTAERLYDLEADAGEQQDLLARAPDAAARLRTAAAEYWTAGRDLRHAYAPAVRAQTQAMDETNIPAGLDAQMLKRLRTLGYLD